MYISEEDAALRLNSPDNLVNLKARSFVDRMLSDAATFPLTEKQEVINSGTQYNYTAGNKQRPPDETLPPEVKIIQTKQKGDVAIPSFIKEIVAADAHLTSAREAGAQFNVPASTAARLKHDPKLDINDRLTTVRDTALDKVMMSLNLLDHNKVSKCNAKDISTIASNVSKVMEKATPQAREANQVQIIIYSPNQKTEDAYETITVHDVSSKEK